MRKYSPTGAGGAALSLIGVVLVRPSFQVKLALASGAVGDWANQKMSMLQEAGPLGHLGLGLLLGAVWSPCVGPTLGAASLLAAQGRDLPQVALVMLAFGVGAASVMLALGLSSAAAFKRLRAVCATRASSGAQPWAAPS